MTTITYRAGVLAADSRAYSGDKVPIGWKKKIHRLADGALLGVSSVAVGAGDLIRRWVESGDVATNDSLKPDNFAALLIKPDGSVWFACNNLEWTGPLTADYFAIGSGDQVALGAMAMGASASRAVEVAIEHDVWTGGPVMTLEATPVR